jgi:hypothetical protein
MTETTDRRPSAVIEVTLQGELLVADVALYDVRDNTLTRTRISAPVSAAAAEVFVVTGGGVRLVPDPSPGMLLDRRA